MPKAELTLEEESPNFRERELALKFTMKNNGPTALEVLAISPRIPESVVLVETKETSIYAAKATYTALCGELDQLARQVLLVTDKALADRYANLAKEYIRLLINEVTGFFGLFRAYFRMFSGRILRQQLEYRKKVEALFVKIEKAVDARKIFDQVIEPSDLEVALKRVFAFKMEKIEALENELGQKTDIGAIATVEPDSFFAATYILRFPRNSMNPSRFTVSIEATYREQSKPEEHNGIATTSVTISPHPLVLTFVSMFAAALGVVLKHVVPAVTSGENWDPRSIPVADFIASLILALIFFNAFEFTDLLKDFRKNIGWRSAMLIGVICGLASDRIFDALKALIGG